MSVIEVEKDIPAPVSIGRIKYPFRSMEIGDSFFVPSINKSVDTIRINLITAARNYKPKKFTTATENNGKGPGVRIWRIE